MITTIKPFLLSSSFHIFIFAVALGICKITSVKTIDSLPLVIDFTVSEETSQEQKSTLEAPIPPKPKTIDQSDQVSSISSKETPVTDTAKPDTQKLTNDTLPTNESSKAVQIAESIQPQIEKSDGGNSTEQLVSKYIKDQFTYIRKIISSHIVYPERAQYRHEEGKLLLSFVIKEDGSVSNIKVVQSSGFKILDENAIASIQKSAPFPKPPFVAELKIPITYELF